ncbi:P-selectin isoform X1 [Sorex fumeus]|uniref:P-selectin isoform X1 n=1 Tax=Sorex fumeus TaxID=62283 RepID=UPI0024AE0B39|nr:P-selectin isoform X1 [Sorex fumeus]
MPDYQCPGGFLGNGEEVTFPNAPDSYTYKHTRTGGEKDQPGAEMASCLRTFWNQRQQRVFFRAVQALCFTALISELTHHPGVSAWTYHYSTKAYSWNASRAFCKKSYTDLVAIQNRQELEYLNKVIPPFSSYYWIGIRRVNDTWMWVGTGKALTQEAENWADNEPNNKKNNQDCVEMYIKRQTAPGTWNDEPCWKKKRALCYTASCNELSCSRQGECVETIGNYSCACYPGFYGPECEFVNECGEPELSEHVLGNCSHPLANFSFNSKCSFHCAPGYTLRGPSELQCLASGMWTSTPPECVALRCQDLSAPAKARMNCSHPDGDLRFQSTCSFSCLEGFVLVGEPVLHCLATGGWSDPLPTCQAITCPELYAPMEGSLRCAGPPGQAVVGTTCYFSCHEGFQLEGFDHVDCTAAGSWTAPPPTCTGIVLRRTPEVRCPVPRIPAQGTISCRHHLGRFGLNTTCYFACQAGFRLMGRSELSCRDPGQWTAATPTCRAVTCSELQVAGPLVANCSNPWGNTSYGSSCSFHCPETQFLNGSAKTVCQADGQWSAPVPLCQVGPLTTQQVLAYVGAAVAPTAGLLTGSLFLVLLRRRRRQKDDGKSPLNPHSHLGTDGVFTNAAFDSSS